MPGALSRFCDDWELSGDSLKRPPRGYPADHPLIEDLKRKDHIAVTHLKKSDLKAANITGDGKAVLRTGLIGEINGMKIFPAGSLTQ